MGKLFERIRSAVEDDRFIVSWHADERCEQREVSVWQLAVGINHAELVQERPHGKPHPAIVVRQNLVDGSNVEAIWAWLPESKRAKLVTVYFRD